MTKGNRALIGVGFVDTTTESILSGNGTCGVPCTKHKVYCPTPLKVEPSACKKKKKECCDGM